jgi:hypothetical protein
MAVSRYPCRVCGRATDGEDTYVICDSCLADLEPPPSEPRSADAEFSSVRLGGSLPIPLSPDEVEERLKRLLDDW